MYVSLKKAFFCTLCFSVFFSVNAQTDIPKKLNLVFEDRIFTVNFRTHPDLLSQAPKHSLSVGGIQIPISLSNGLSEVDSLLPINTEFKTVVSKEQLQKYFESTSLSIQHDSKPVEVRFDDFGNIIFEGGSPQGGFEINYERLIALMNKALKEKDIFVRVPATKTYSETIVHPDLKARGIQEIIAVGESNFSGSSSARRQNIRAAIRKFNGTIIKKGRTFSFNNILKSVEEKDGFVKELVIKGNETTKELGGGVCQVSTTAFRAAFNGGLPLVNRRNHSYAVPYYKPYGLDATIYLGAQDFRFKNDTPGDLLMQAYVKGDNAYFVFYGTSDNRTVQLEGPFISNYRPEPDAIIYETEDFPWGHEEIASEGHAGFRAEWIRTVSKNGQSETENISSNYRAWPAKVIRGIGSSEDPTVVAGE